MVVTDRTAGFYWLSGFLRFEPCPDIDRYIRLGQVLSMQAATCDTICHVTAQLPVGGSGVHVSAASPIAQRVDLRTGIGSLQFLSRCIALAEDQAIDIKDVFPVNRCPWPCGSGPSVLS